MCRWSIDIIVYFFLSLQCVYVGERANHLCFILIMGISQKLEVVLRPWGLIVPQTLFLHPFVFLVEAHIGVPLCSSEAPPTPFLHLELPEPIPQPNHPQWSSSLSNLAANNRKINCSTQIINQFPKYVVNVTAINWRDSWVWHIFMDSCGTKGWY